MLRTSRLHKPLALLVCAGWLLLGCTSIDTPSPGGLEVDRMDGRWVSTDDPRSVIEIADGRMTDIYDGEVMGSGAIEWVDSCPGSPAGDGPSFTVSDDEGSVLCYHLLTVDDDTLEYSYAARGNTLSYRRIE